MTLLIRVTYYLFTICRVCGDVTYLLPDFSNLYSPSFFPENFTRSLVILIVSKSQLFVSLIFFIVSAPYFIYSMLIFITLFLIHTLYFIFFSYSSFAVEVYITELKLSSFPIQKKNITFFLLLKFQICNFLKIYLTFMSFIYFICKMGITILV